MQHQSYKMDEKRRINGTFQRQSSTPFYTRKQGKYVFTDRRRQVENLMHENGNLKSELKKLEKDADQKIKDYRRKNEELWSDLKTEQIQCKLQTAEKNRKEKLLNKIQRNGKKESLRKSKEIETLTHFLNQSQSHAKLAEEKRDKSIQLNNKQNKTLENLKNQVKCLTEENLIKQKSIEDQADLIKKTRSNYEKIQIKKEDERLQETKEKETLNHLLNQEQIKKQHAIDELNKLKQINIDQKMALDDLKSKEECLTQYKQNKDKSFVKLAKVLHQTRSNFEQEKNNLKAEISNLQEKMFSEAAKCKREKADLESKRSDLVEKYEVLEEENCRLEKELDRRRNRKRKKAKLNK